MNDLTIVITGAARGLDALVNNAGFLGPVGPLAEADAGAWSKNWAVEEVRR